VKGKTGETEYENKENKGTRVAVKMIHLFAKAKEKRE
jgi:hypothetical protein